MNFDLDASAPSQAVPKNTRLICQSFYSYRENQSYRGEGSGAPETVILVAMESLRYSQLVLSGNRNANGNGSDCQSWDGEEITSKGSFGFKLDHLA